MGNLARNGRSHLRRTGHLLAGPLPILSTPAQNKAVIYDLLFKAASETMLTIVADPGHLARWPGLGVVPAGVPAAGARARQAVPPVVADPAVELFDAGRLQFHGRRAALCERRTFLRHLAPTRKKPWIVYAKPSFAGPAAVLAYLSRYTHRVAISNRRLLALDARGVTFRDKDYRRSGAERDHVMTLATDEFIRRFLLHVLPRGFHRIRHYGLLSSGRRRDNLARARALLATPLPAPEPDEAPEP